MKWRRCNIFLLIYFTYSYFSSCTSNKDTKLSWICPYCPEMSWRCSCKLLDRKLLKYETGVWSWILWATLETTLSLCSTAPPAGRAGNYNNLMQFSPAMRQIFKVDQKSLLKLHCGKQQRIQVFKGIRYLICRNPALKCLKTTRPLLYFLLSCVVTLLHWCSHQCSDVGKSINLLEVTLSLLPE